MQAEVGFCSCCAAEALDGHPPDGRVNFVEFAAKSLRGTLSLLALGVPMFDPTTTALLRAVFDEVCEDVSCYETGARTHVASRILEAATNGDTSPERLKQVGREALHDAPSMWR
jgi:hypothetical protein